MTAAGIVLGACLYLVHINATNALSDRPYGHAWVCAGYALLGGVFLGATLAIRWGGY